MRRKIAVRFIRITHIPSGTKLAEGPVGWGITPFEGNLYVRRKYLLTESFRPNFHLGFCPYKFLYVWLDLVLNDKTKIKDIGWFYWLPNPLFPFVAFRVGLPGNHPELQVEQFQKEANSI
ncbi:MAG: hypothetical protein V3U24_01795 [Candidatus Neomarinimicrobiota bacterium]